MARSARSSPWRRKSAPGRAAYPVLGTDALDAGKDVHRPVSLVQDSGSPEKIRGSTRAPLRRRDLAEACEDVGQRGRRNSRPGKKNADSVGILDGHAAQGLTSCSASRRERRRAALLQQSQDAAADAGDQTQPTVMARSAMDCCTSTAPAKSRMIRPGLSGEGTASATRIEGISEQQTAEHGGLRQTRGTPARVRRAPRLHCNASPDAPWKRGTGLQEIVST